MRLKDNESDETSSGAANALRVVAVPDRDEEVDIGQHDKARHLLVARFN